MIKKLLPALLLVLFAGRAGAQTVTFSLPVPPCHSDGVLTAHFAGFTPPLTVTWITHGTLGATVVHTVTGTSDAITSYSGGPAHIFVTDGTLFASDFYAGAPPVSYSTATVGAVCPSLGSVSAIASGGTAPYTYKWLDKATSAVIATGATASLPTGNYGVMVTDAAGCEYGSKFQDDTIAVTYTSFTATVSATPANCTDGIASVLAVDPSAVMPISYHWSNGAASSSITGLTRGVYTVEITDALGCRASMDTAMAYHPYSVFVDQTTIISLPSTATPTTCTASDGAIALFPSGGTAPYTYVWSNGATTASQTGLTSGTYMVTVTDANGCIGENNIFVGTSTPISVTSASAPSLCTSPTGNASVSPAGGTPPYSYLWYTTPVHTTSTAASLAPGTYSFKVTDAVGCVQTGSVVVPPVNIISTTFTATSPLCALSNGTLSVTATGGATPYSYSWNTGGTGSSITSIPQGGYDVTVTDAMGCKVKPSFYLSSYSPVGIGMSTTEASCIFSNDGAVTATPYGGTAPYTYSWTSGGTAPTISSLTYGHYWVNVTDASGCHAGAHAYVGYDAAATSCYCTIEGTVYGDANANCALDGTETGVPHVQVYCSGIGYTYTDASGHYSFIVPSGSYTVTETLQPFYSLSPCQLNNIPVTASAGAGCVHTIDFANTMLPVHNMRITTSTVIPPVPGHVMYQRLVMINEGTLTEDSVFTSYRPDGQLLTPSFVSPGFFTGGSNYYTTTTPLGTMIPGDEREFTVSYNVPGNIPLGTNVTFRDTTAYNSATGAWLADFTPADNVCNNNTTVVASYDPNFKEVSPRGAGVNGIIYPSDSVLEYTIHFQNTGTWYADDVVILDTLDSDLDWTSLHPVYESAPCQVNLYQAGTAKVARFSFHNINLPPQMFDDLRSTGLVTYSVKTLPGLAVGTQFKNRASIYFDYNAPVMTNTTTNTIGNPGSVIVNNAPSFESTSFLVYPNPASTSFVAVLNNEHAGSAAMTLSDLTGKTIISRQLTLVPGTQSINTDITNIAAGVYFVNITCSGRTQTQKLVVIR